MSAPNPDVNDLSGLYFAVGKFQEESTRQHERLGNRLDAGFLRVDDKCDLIRSELRAIADRVLTIETQRADARRLGGITGAVAAVVVTALVKLLEHVWK